MNTEQKNRSTILIVDDSEMNREMLAEILKDDYDTIEAADGKEAIAAIKAHENEIDLVLLDIVMPEMDGFEVLALMNRYKWIDSIPVIMISAEGDFSFIKKAYDLGVTDYIQRPYQSYPIHRRIDNTLMLYNKQKRLLNIVEEQVYAKEKDNRTMINILGHIVEFRNGESGMHVHHIQTITRLLLRRLVQKTDKYDLTEKDILQIITASSLHDIGKIVLENYVEEQDTLVVEEMRFVRTHSTLGYELLQGRGYSDFVLESILYHHENYDGTGYPANLAGEKIPFGARILRICDVYCALTSDRPYRSAFTREQAMELMTEEVKNFDLKMFLAFQRVIHSGSRKAIELSDVDELIREIIKEKTENGIKKETGYRNERYFTERNGNP